MKKMNLIYWLVLILTIGIVWMFRPWFHSPIMFIYTRPIAALFGIFFVFLLSWLIADKIRKADPANPSIFQKIIVPITVFHYFVFLISFWFFIFVLIIEVSILSKIMKGKKTENSKSEKPNFGRRRFFIFSCVVVLIIWFLTLSFEADIAYLITSKKIDFKERQNFPIVDPIRILPKEVATRYASDSFQNPQEYLGDSQIVLVKGEIKRVFPRLPEGSLLYFINKMSGFMVIDVSSLERKAEVIDQPFKYSEGVGVFDNIYFQLYKKKFFVEYYEPIYLFDSIKNEWVTVVPYASYKYFPIRMPVWGGFMVVYSDGRIEDHKPEDAMSLSFTKNNRVFPKELARYYTESYAYKGGLINKWFFHKDQPMIDETEDEPQPFHISTTEGYKQVLFAKPVSSSYGIFKIFIFDATSGEAEIMNFDQNSLLSGAVTSIDYVRRRFPYVDYDSFFVAEPRPFVVNNNFYWLFSLIDAGGAGVAYTVAVDARTNEVIIFNNEGELKNFMKGGTASYPVNTPANTSTNNDQIKIDTSDKEKIKETLKAIEYELNYIRELIK